MMNGHTNRENPEEICKNVPREIDFQQIDTNFQEMKGANFRSVYKMQNMQNVL